MALLVSARSNDVNFRIPQDAGYNAVMVYLDSELVIVTDSQVGSGDLVLVARMSPAITADIVNSLMAGEGHRSKLPADRVADLTFLLDRYRCKIGKRPLIRVLLDGQLLRTFFLDAEVVDAQYTYEDRPAS